MRCFACLAEFEDPEFYLSHIQNNTCRLCGTSDYRCNLCLAIFDVFGNFKKHVRKCVQKSQQPQHIEAIEEAFIIHNDLTMEYSDEITDFKQFVQKTALEMVLNMSSNMNIPRELVFTTISDFQAFITKTFIHGNSTH